MDACVRVAGEERRSNRAGTREGDTLTHMVTWVSLMTGTTWRTVFYHLEQAAIRFRRLVRTAIEETGSRNRNGRIRESLTSRATGSGTVSMYTVHVDIRKTSRRTDLNSVPLALL